jgi:hypothetical protein
MTQCPPYHRFLLLASQHCGRRQIVRRPLDEVVCGLVIITEQRLDFLAQSVIALAA